MINIYESPQIIAVIAEAIFLIHTVTLVIVDWKMTRKPKDSLKVIVQKVPMTVRLVETLSTILTVR